MNKIKWILALFIVCILNACETSMETNQKAIENKLKSQNVKEKASKEQKNDFGIPREVEQILMPPGYSDYLIIIRAEEDSDPFTGEKFYETRPIASAQAQGVGDESTNITIIKRRDTPARGDFVVTVSKQ